jgi:hypothetical protein
LDVKFFISSSLVQFPDGDGPRLAGLEAEVAKDAFIQIFFYNGRSVPGFLENADGADPDTSPALRYADAGGHVYVHTNELAGGTHSDDLPFIAFC